MAKRNHAGTDTRFKERRRGDRRDLLPLLKESFDGIYLWHARWILRGRATVLTAERNRVPVGLAMLKPLAPGVGYVYYLAIAGAERKQGTGGRLLDRSLSCLVSRGARVVLACVPVGNVPSERLFASRDFRVCRLRNLVGYFGPARALRIWFGMTATPRERVWIRLP